MFFLKYSEPVSAVEGIRESAAGCFGMHVHYYYLRDGCPLMIVRLEVLNELVMNGLDLTL